MTDTDDPGSSVVNNENTYAAPAAAVAPAVDHSSDGSHLENVVAGEMADDDSSASSFGSPAALDDTSPVVLPAPTADTTVTTTTKTRTSFKDFILGAPDQDRNNYDIYERNPYVSNAIVALPPSIAMFCNGLMITVDGVVVGQMAGPQDFAAMGYASGFDPLVKTFGNFVAVGAPQVIAEALGKGDMQLAERCLGLSIFINVMLTIIVMAILIPTAPAFMAFAGAEGILLDKSLEYAYPLCYGAFFFILQRAICGCVLAEGRSNLSCALTIIVTIVNSAFGPILVGPAKLGITGSAVASAIAAGVGAIAALACYATGITSVRLRFKYMIPKNKDDWKLIGRVCYVGMGDFVGNLANAFVSVIINRIATQILRDNVTLTEAQIVGGIAAQSAMFRIWNLINETMQGISSQGLIPLVAFAYGRRDGRRMFDVLKANAVITLCLGLFFFLLCEIFAPYLVRIFGSDHEYMVWAPTVLRIGLAGVPILSPQFYMVSYAQAVGDGLTSTILSIVCYGVYVPCFFIGLGLGTNNMYIADIGLPLNDICSDITCFLLLSRSVLNFRKHLWPEGEEPPETLLWLQKRAEKELLRRQRRARRLARAHGKENGIAELAAVGVGSEYGDQIVINAAVEPEAELPMLDVNFGPGAGATGRRSIVGVPAAALRASIAGRRSLAVARQSTAIGRSSTVVGGARPAIN